MVRVLVARYPSVSSPPVSAVASSSEARPEDSVPEPASRHSPTRALADEMTRTFVLLVVALLSGGAFADAAVTYVKPNFAYVNEWSPAADRSAAATKHSAAMKAYSDALEENPRRKPCVYC